AIRPGMAPHRGAVAGGRATLGTADGEPATGGAGAGDVHAPSSSAQTTPRIQGRVDARRNGWVIALPTRDRGWRFPRRCPQFRGWGVPPRSLRLLHELPLELARALHRRPLTELVHLE